MIDQLKQVGILYGEGKDCQMTGENIKSADYSKMSKEEVEEFCQSLEILLAVGIEGEIDSLIEECPCMLLWFAQSAPEILPEKYDAAFVKTSQKDEQDVVRLFAMLAQQTLEEGFDVFGQLEDIIIRFTNFTHEEPCEECSLLLWLGSDILEASQQQQEFLGRAQQLSQEAEEQGIEFFCSHSLAEQDAENKPPVMILFAAEEKMVEE